MVSSTIYTNHSSSFSNARTIWRNWIFIGCSFHGWLFKDWPFDFHDSGAFRTGLGVVVCSSHNTVTKTTPSICIFNQFKSRRSLCVELLDANKGLPLPCNTIGFLTSANWATGSRGKITGLSKCHWEWISPKERACCIRGGLELGLTQLLFVLWFDAAACWWQE